MITIGPPLKKLSLTERYDLFTGVQGTPPIPEQGFSDSHLELLRLRKLAANKGYDETVDYEVAIVWLRASN